MATKVGKELLPVFGGEEALRVIAHAERRRFGSEEFATQHSTDDDVGQEYIYTLYRLLGWIFHC